MGVFDAHLLHYKEGDFLPEPVILSLETDACVPVVGGPASGAGQRELSQRNRVDDGRSDGPRPALGQGNPYVSSDKERLIGGTCRREDNLLGSGTHTEPRSTV